MTGLEDQLRDHLPDDWSDPVLDDVVSAAVPVTFAEGEVLLGPERPPMLAVVTEGLVTVWVEGVEVARLGPGAFIGEMSWLEGGRPLAIVRAASSGSLARIDDTRGVVREHGTVIAHLRRLADRRAATNRAVAVTPVRASTRPGRDLHLRPMWPDDWRRLDAHRGRVSAASLERRFFHQPNLSVARLQRLTDVDYRDEFVWVATDTSIAAVGRYGRPRESPDVAEIALLVADDWQGYGVGRLLVAALAIAASVQGIPTFEAIVRSDNDAVRGLLDRYGPDWGRGEEAGTLVGRWPVAPMLDAPDVRALPEGVRSVAEAVVGGVDG